MEASFWHERWEKHEIGFHKNEVNPTLLKFQSSLQVVPGKTVLVPLCGKSLDMKWLKEQGMSVVGVELSPLACEEFFKDSHLPFEKLKKEGFDIYESDGITLWCGDFFLLPENLKFDSIYDRASNIALPPQMRKAYYEKLQRFLGPHTKLLLLTIEYDESLLPGPPFSVPEEEIRKAYSGFEITKLVDRTVDLENPRFAEAQAIVTEKVYQIRLKSKL